MPDDKIIYPICPINMYFEGDESICDLNQCDWEQETRSCTEGCRQHD